MLINLSSDVQTYADKLGDLCGKDVGLVRQSLSTCAAKMLDLCGKDSGLVRERFGRVLGVKKERIRKIEENGNFSVKNVYKHWFQFHHFLSFVRIRCGSLFRVHCSERRK